MQWYVFLLTIPAVYFLGQVIVELILRPVQTILSLRHRALERLAAFHDMALPGPRELAVSSLQIRKHDHSVRNVRLAQRTFADLGAELKALGESEPLIGAVMRLGGLDMERAGDQLISLSEIYATATIDSDEIRHAIEKARHAASCALGVAQRRTGVDELTRIRLEPISLQDTALHDTALREAALHDAAWRRRARPHGRPSVIPRRAPARAMPVSRAMARSGK